MWLSVGASTPGEHAQPMLVLEAGACSCAALACISGGTVDQLQLKLRARIIPDGMWFVMCAAVRRCIIAASGTAASG